MSSKHSKGMHHPHGHTGQHYTHERDGWVEGIAGLKEGDKAVELLSEEPSAYVTKAVAAGANGNGATSCAPAAAANGSTAKAEPAAAAGAAGASSADGAAGDSAGAGGVAANVPVVVTRAEDFEICMEHALQVLSKELDAIGEQVLEVGTASGWGPVGLTPEQLEVVLTRMTACAGELSCDMTVMRRRKVSIQTTTGPLECSVADVLLRRKPGARPAMEVRVAIIGNVDSGKSTMVGVLTRAMLDDGRGAARAKVFKHHHEESTGRTSCIGQHTLCLDAGGHILNDSLFRTQTCGEYIARSSKVMTLVDLAGHEKYFRTTAYGLTGHLPDYACLIVGANMGVVGMCKEHLGVALALRVPVFFIVTKVDICPEHILKQTVANLASILKKPGVRKRPFLVRNEDDVLLCARNMASDSLAPIFLTSAVTGRGLDLVRMFYNLLPQRYRWADKQVEMAEFVIDETFGVPGVGTVVAGTIKRGVITPNTTLLMGPDVGDGSFKHVAVKSIHYKRLPVGQVVAGQTAALALKKVKRSQVRKGMVLVDERLKPKASWEFDADIAILTHSTTIQPRYQAVIHCEIIRQAARVIAMDKERLRSGDRACVRFRFIQRPEYITAGTRFVFREGRTKGIGIVVGTEHDPSRTANTASAPSEATGGMAVPAPAAAAAGGAAGGADGGVPVAAPAGAVDAAV